MGESHVIIVGGGVIGMSLAWRLTGAGALVSVIDAGAGAPPALCIASRRVCSDLLAEWSASCLRSCVMAGS